jgi:hypothetical protein
MPKYHTFLYHKLSQNNIFNIKAFLTAVTSPICDIHDNCLMNAIRSVYNVSLITCFI